jgi:hypothetical protein
MQAIYLKVVRHCHLEWHLAICGRMGQKVSTFLSGWPQSRPTVGQWILWMPSAALRWFRLLCHLFGRPKVEQPFQAMLSMQMFLWRCFELARQPSCCTVAKFSTDTAQLEDALGVQLCAFWASWYVCLQCCYGPDALSLSGMASLCLWQCSFTTCFTTLPIESWCIQRKQNRRTHKKHQTIPDPIAGW